jgi:hypothetical protein
MTDYDSDLEKAEGQLIAIGKAIEHSNVQDAKASKKDGATKNKELAKRFAKALGEVEKDGEEPDVVKDQQKGLMRKLLRGIKNYLLKGKGDKANESQEKQAAKDKSTAAASEKSVKNLSAELEVAVARLKSVSSVDSSKNDMDITKEMEKVLSISAELSSKVPANKSPDLEKAGFAIADVSVTFKNNSASVAQVSEQSQSLDNAKETVGQSAAININATTNNIRESFENQSTVDGDPQKTPITKAAQLEKERRNAAAMQKTDPSRGG